MRPIQVIRLSRRDTIDTACELLRGARDSAQVWVVLARRSAIGSTPFNLKRLQRVADAQHIDVRLVTGHSPTRSLARGTGLAVHRALPPNLWGVGRGRHVPAAEGRVQDYAGRLAFWWEHRPSRMGAGALLLSVLVILVLVVSLGATAALLIPSATITLTPRSQDVTASAELQAATYAREILYGESPPVVPGRENQVFVTSRAETPATGLVQVADGHASGEVVFANRTDTEVIVPKGTIVRTSTGVNLRFYTVSEVTLPAKLYGHARVPVIAMEAGPDSNVAALTISTVEGDIADMVDVINDVPTEGGTNASVPEVANKDLDTLRGVLTEVLYDEAYRRLVEQLDETEFIPRGAYLIGAMSDVEFEHQVGERNDVLGGKQTVFARGIAVDQLDVDELARQLLLSRSSDTGHRVIEDSLVIERSAVTDLEQNNYHPIAARFVITASAKVAAGIDTEQVQADSVNRSPAEVAASLFDELPLRHAPDIQIEPSFWPRLPILPARIEVVITSED